MKTRILLIATALICKTASAQQVAKTVIAEHFTNTYCSVCASNNPGLFSNLNAFPQVLHIAYYPSSPYPACPLSMHNQTENNARTNYYGVFGSTPRLVVGGSVATPPYTSATIYTSQLPLTTSFTLTTSMVQTSTDSITVTIVVKKVDTSSLTSLQLFGAVVEDTLFFAANNGETKHYDVFRKALWGTTPLSLTAPSSVGDSTVLSKTVSLNTVWVKSRLYAVAVLQRGDKQVVQASKSMHLPVGTDVKNVGSNASVSITPNPASDIIVVKGVQNGTSAVIINEIGVAVKTLCLNGETAIDISGLPQGGYVFLVNGSNVQQGTKFIKR